MYISDWVLIGTSLFLGAVALVVPYLSELITRKYFAPDMRINFQESPPACHKTRNSANEPVYYFRFEVENKGKSQAKRCEVVIENLVIADAAGNFPTIQTYTPVNLNWGAFNPEYIEINPRRKIYCNLLFIPSKKTQTQVKQKGNRYIDPFECGEFDLGVVVDVRQILYVQPNRLPPGKYRLDVVVYSENAKEARRSFVVTWSGRWKDEEENMFKELVIE